MVPENNTTKSQLETLFTNKQAASRLNVDPVTLWRLRKAGKLRAVKVGSKVMWPESTLQQFVADSQEGEE